MDRKSFIKNTALSVFSLSFLGKAVEAAPGKFKGECETSNDILGPFYRANAPQRNNLIIPGVKGNAIQISGKVFGDDCITPIENTIVDIWHCDTAGNYDNDSDEYRHRASAVTLKDGAYQFKTIIPGKYLNGRLYRPAHIHFRVRAKRYKELISQIYFKGDPHIEEDPWASKKKAQHRILQVFPDDIESNLSVKFDIYLSKV